MDWIHWIGKKYYSIENFAKEGKKFGISRRVSLRQLSRMSWGDRVYCIQKKPKYRNGSIFASFPIKMLIGVSREAWDRIAETFPTQKVSDGGEEVERECGSYITGETHEVKTSLKSLAQFLTYLEKGGMNIGKPMVGCSPSYFSSRIKPWAIMKDIPFQLGFRDLDFDSYWKTYGLQRKAKPDQEPQLRGRFRVEVSQKETRKGNVQEVSDYKKRD